MSYSSQIDLSQLTKRDYGRAFLKRNPFPSTAIPEKVPMITVDRDKVIDHFKDVIVHLYDDETTNVTVLVGGYGSGKSHILKVFKNNINSQLLDNEVATYGIYVKSPGRSFLELFFYIIEDIGREFLTEVSSKLIRKFLKDTWPESQKYLIKTEDWSIDDIENESMETIFKKLLTLNCQKGFSNSYLGLTKNADILSSLFFLSYPTYSGYAWRWFLGDNLSREEKNYLNISSTISDNRDSLTILNALFNIFRVVDISNIVIFIDELERILTLTSMQKTQFQDDIRHLIDENPKNTSIFFAKSPEEWSKMIEQPTALIRRLSGNIFRLDDFDKERIKLLIEGYLFYSRIDDYTENILDEEYIDCNKKIFPFTEDSLEKILKVTKGRISSLIQLCRKSVDFYLDSLEEYNVINEEVIEIISKKEGY